MASRGIAQFWLDSGWLCWTGDRLCSWLGTPDGTEDGGFARIYGCEPNAVLLLAHNGRRWRFSYVPEDVMNLTRLDEVPHG